MNAAVIVIFGIAWYIFAYQWYARIIQKKVLKVRDENITPANKVNDDLDYVPTKPSILFGHHFSSIAGAGPIVGPILGFALFGWLPALIWILLGAVFLGAVHDYASLVASLRNDGVSIVQFTKTAVSNKARSIFSVFVWLTLTLVQAVFADLTARTLHEDPTIVIPTLGVIAVAIIFGYFVNRKGFNTIIGTILGLGLFFVLILLGRDYPIVASYDFWLVFTIIYSFVAAIIPVWVVLQPRDYLSMYLLIIGLALGVIGVIALNPTLEAPAFISFNSKNGPLFPILFITIACGAVSGFHSLVSSGTSAKQLRKESDAKFVSYGAMLTEGLLALLVIVMIAGALHWTPAGANDPLYFGSLLDQSANLVFGTALGATIETLGVPFKIGVSFGVLMINAFLLTSLDTSTRLNRYIIQETLGAKYKGIFNNRFFAAAASLVLAYFLAKGGYEVIWPVFGASNQLIATLSLFVVTAYFLGFKAPKWYTLLPAIFMLLVTETALAYNILTDYMPNSKWHLAAISIALFILGLIVAIETTQKLKKLNKENK